LSRRRPPPTIEEAKLRLQNYQSPFLRDLKISRAFSKSVRVGDQIAFRMLGDTEPSKDGGTVYPSMKVTSSPP
jgi:hypothetical protein